MNKWEQRVRQLKSEVAEGAAVNRFAGVVIATPWILAAAFVLGFIVRAA